MDRLGGHPNRLPCRYKEPTIMIAIIVDDNDHDGAAGTVVDSRGS
jgi:hypothetical protein